MTTAATCSTMKTLSFFWLSLATTATMTAAFQVPTISRTVGPTTTTPFTKLQMAETDSANLLSDMDALWQTYPYTAAALVCGFKASAADMVAQFQEFSSQNATTSTTTLETEDTNAVAPRVMESSCDDSMTESPPSSFSMWKEATDWKRNAAFIAYGSLYQGITQEYIYNHLYPIWFGSGTSLDIVLTKVAFTCLVVATTLTLPSLYASKALLEGFSLKQAAEQYVYDIKYQGLLQKFYILWGPVLTLTFAVIPEQWRVTFIALISFFWLIVLSQISSSSKDKNAGEQQQHLVLVGGGHAHAQVIKALNKASRPANLRVTLIDQQASASYSGMVPGCICQRYTHEETLLHLRPLAAWAGIDFVQDKVIDVDLERKVIHLANQNNKDDNEQKGSSSIAFDAISMDIGSTSRGLDDTPGAHQFTIPTRPISKLVERLEQSEKYMDSDAEPRIVVIGGGAAGVELSMSLNGRFQRKFPKAQVTLLDVGTELLGGESRRGREKLQEIMGAQGIQIVHQCRVDEVSDDRIFATIANEKHQIIPFTHCIWATGAGAHPLAMLLQAKGLDATKYGWISVNEYLQSTSHPWLFAAGDCCNIENLEKGSPPKAGVFAVRAGPVLIENLTAYLRQQQQPKHQQQQSDDPESDECLNMKPYVPQTDFLKLLVCGDGKALGLRFGQAFYGKWVMDLKDKIDTNFMDLFKEENLPDLRDGGEYDTSQYDANMATKTDLDPQEAAVLLSRTDDDVDYHVAWSVIRTMADDEQYRNQVLSFMEEGTAVPAS